MDTNPPVATRGGETPQAGVNAKCGAFDPSALVTRERFGPIIRAFGIRKAAARAGITYPPICDWINHGGPLSLEARLKLLVGMGWRVDIAIREPRRRGPKPTGRSNEVENQLRGEAHGASGQLGERLTRAD